MSSKQMEAESGWERQSDAVGTRGEEGGRGRGRKKKKRESQRKSSTIPLDNKSNMGTI